MTSDSQSNASKEELTSTTRGPSNPPPPGTDTTIRHSGDVPKPSDPPATELAVQHEPLSPTRSPIPAPQEGLTGSTTTFGDYELLSEVARGGMGVVFRARQTSLNRVVALKMILAGQLASEQDVARFQSEAQAAANLDHPGIVPVYEVGEHDGQLYFSMNFVEGESLAEKISQGPQPSEQAVMLAQKIAESISYAHEHGVIHRDLKPGNVLLDRNGDPKVTDFGLAKRVEDGEGLTLTGQILGTPSYMPPEQAAGKSNQVNEAADVYAVGAILYALLTGRPPFLATTPVETLLQVLERDPVAPRQLNREVPRELECVCLKCLEKDQAHRYSTASELAEDLKRFSLGEPVLAEASSTLRRAWSAMLRETRHVEVMAHWGHVWMWQAVQIFLLFTVTNAMIWAGIESPLPIIALWCIGFACLLVPVWYYRFRNGIPLTPIERQLGQIWSIFGISVVTTGLINHLMGFEPLFLLPLAVVECGMAFGCMAAILGGSFYPMALLCLGLAVLLALLPQVGPFAFGAAFAVGLFIPGWRFSRKRPATRELPVQQQAT